MSPTWICSSSSQILHLCVFHFSSSFSTQSLAPFISVPGPPSFFLTALHLATEQYRAAGCQDKPDPRRPRRAAPSTAQTQTPVSTQGWGEKMATYTTDTTWKLGVGKVLPGKTVRHQDRNWNLTQWASSFARSLWSKAARNQAGPELTVRRVLAQATLTKPPRTLAFSAPHDYCSDHCSPFLLLHLDALRKKQSSLGNRIRLGKRFFSWCWEEQGTQQLPQCCTSPW